MKEKQLSGIERELVLQYLIDGNVPVTITPLDSFSPSDSSIHSVKSQVFPIAIHGEHLKVCDNGKIFLENPTQSILQYINQNIKAEFYFNRVGLFFESLLQASNEGIFLTIPDVIDRIEDVEEQTQYDFIAKFYYDFNNKAELNRDCFPWEEIDLFSRPVWKIIPLQNQKKAKDLLEKLVEDAKIEKNIGNGLQLIPVCDFLTFSFPNKMEALENRVKPLKIIFIDHERIVFAIESGSENFTYNNEYGLKMSFSLKKGPVTARDIFVTVKLNKSYKNEDNCTCFEFKYTSIQEEDLRFLYEKTSSSKLI